MSLYGGLKYLYDPLARRRSAPTAVARYGGYLYDSAPELAAPRIHPRVGRGGCTPRTGAAYSRGLLEIIPRTAR